MRWARAGWGRQGRLVERRWQGSSRRFEPGRDKERWNPETISFGLRWSESSTHSDKHDQRHTVKLLEFAGAFSELPERSQPMRIRHFIKHIEGGLCKADPVKSGELWNNRLD
ncbi:hypothetical protein B296_00027254 [Ensete ventricosum]|uniref:Uncharacterized protein n=1 Tax=Ensete ventricosum TaxID=4639 RepID=A0A426YGI1_ENSVE|nr:hypothetical protein B296_00027254 [Ensete ventricosum]